MFLRWLLVITSYRAIPSAVVESPEVTHLRQWASATATPLLGRVSQSLTIPNKFQIARNASYGNYRATWGSEATIELFASGKGYWKTL